jgi:hypothetical protein
LFETKPSSLLWDRTVTGVIASSTTDASGRFQFENVAPGEYIVRAEREGFMGAFAASDAMISGFAPATYSIGGIVWSAGSAPPALTAKTLSGEAQNITVEAQKTTPDLSLTMIRAGVITGRVLDDGGIVVNAPRSRRCMASSNRRHRVGSSLDEDE